MVEKYNLSQNILLDSMKTSNSDQHFFRILLFFFSTELAIEIIIVNTNFYKFFHYEFSL